MQKYTLKKQWDSNMKIINSWACMISQTGSELIAISRETGYLPSLLVTNNYTKIPQDNLRFLREKGITIVTIPFRPVLEDYLFVELIKKKLITLHGFLRILPPDFFKHYKGEIYNGHPGLITEYSELKGKDPQIRAWKGAYNLVGSVVHKVTEGVDEGEVVKFSATPNTAQSLDDMYYTLRNTSLEAWKNFFQDNWKFEE